MPLPPTKSRRNSFYSKSIKIPEHAAVINRENPTHLSGVSQKVRENGHIVLNRDILAQTESKIKLSDISVDIH